MRSPKSLGYTWSEGAHPIPSKLIIRSTGILPVIPRKFIIRSTGILPVIPSKFIN
ncbi:hypothetical protein [Limnofasciculus baicalensis]|uniref:Uncharacterized protein n=1 Tax=Limnofasciculus baicalensis BBK-W-15 TaxID=2699891 RepID=A0AAE3KMJ5_9CYAN|nr:hypothetical protein [Limnofasciculus baicalensis]MCP2729299.1 hypothetical protein [Limnofasciculus baicalensis BBK-W-15]